MNTVGTAFQADSYVGPASEDLQETLPSFTFLMYSSLNVDTEKLGKRRRRSPREEGTVAWQCRRE